MIYQAEVDASVVNKFPGKLWSIVNGPSTAIRWGSKGKSIVVNQTAFEKEFLTKESPVFKTNNMGSFIRQLNLYGFRKITAFKQIEEDPNSDGPVFLDGSEVFEFHHEHFQRGRPELLTQLRRNVGIRRSREIAMQRRLQREMCQPGFVRVRLPANMLPNQHGQLQLVVTSAPNVQYQLLPASAQPRDMYQAYCVTQPPPMPPAPPAPGPQQRFAALPMQLHGAGDAGFQTFSPSQADGQVAPSHDKIDGPFATMQRNYVLTQQPTATTENLNKYLTPNTAEAPMQQELQTLGTGEGQGPTPHVLARPTLPTASDTAEITDRCTPPRPVVGDVPLSEAVV